VAASTLKALVLIAVALPASQGIAAPAQLENILIDAQSSELDYKNNSLVFHKVRIAQGTMAITADFAVAANQAQASGLDFENSRWTFRSNVKITMADGQLASDEAEISFAHKVVAKALASGKPAVFEQRIAKTGKLAKGHADSIDYDVATGIVHFSKNAWMSDGDREITGQSLKYNVLAQTIVAEAAEQGSQRVHIIITPPPPKSKP
jgi:lipopolysaccharide transport protein LptA